MIDQCEPSIASWSSGGDSFVIKDVEAFSSEILPLYFKHSKFPSFVRQLNFYGFHKLRSDPDLNSEAKVVRFAHEFFRRGQPELLYKIQRSTKAADEVISSSSGESVDALKDDINQMNKQLARLSTTIDIKLAALSTNMEADYQRRMASIERSYKILSDMTAALVAGPALYGSPRSIMPEAPELNHSTLFALSGIASLVNSKPVVSEKDTRPLSPV